MASRSRIDKKGAKLGKITIPGKPGPERRHYCPSHDTTMTPLKQFGKKNTMFQCKEGCRLPKNFTVLK
jgi:hypothetical protein